MNAGNRRLSSGTQDNWVESLPQLRIGPGAASPSGSCSPEACIPLDFFLRSDQESTLKRMHLISGNGCTVLSVGPLNPEVLSLFL